MSSKDYSETNYERSGADITIEPSLQQRSFFGIVYWGNVASGRISILATTKNVTMNQIFSWDREVVEYRRETQYFFVESRSILPLHILCYSNSTPLSIIAGSGDDWGVDPLVGTNDQYPQSYYVRYVPQDEITYIAINFNCKSDNCGVATLKVSLGADYISQGDNIIAGTFYKPYLFQVEQLADTEITVSVPSVGSNNFVHDYNSNSITHFKNNKYTNVTILPSPESRNVLLGLTSMSDITVPVHVSQKPISIIPIGRHLSIPTINNHRYYFSINATSDRLVMMVKYNNSEKNSDLMYIRIDRGQYGTNPFITSQDHYFALDTSIQVGVYHMMVQTRCNGACEDITINIYDNDSDKMRGMDSSLTIMIAACIAGAVLIGAVCTLFIVLLCFVMLRCRERVIRHPVPVKSRLDRTESQKRLRFSDDLVDEQF
ncbi:hypothetical protein AKO1_007487 [Acrasis kona]|uniref:IgGFc-binding protein N-terminal domain-containing protein n=1 Tax=Acrasis kona TaxID=1008807 RepID=A0AAW2YT11_9EUKA